MTILGIIGKIVLSLIGLVAGFIIFSTINHRYHLKKENEKYPPPGVLVTVNNKKIHVYSEGQGNITLVFMAGHGTSAPTIDFKPLWMKLSDEYRIIIVEKAGYGWSETSSHSRSIDTILKETRKALELSGENGPFILIPHSMSGLEAIYWAQKYPNEVKAIIGIDPAVPDIYEKNSELLSQNFKLKFMHFMSKIGLPRFLNRKELEKILPLIKSTELSSYDKDRAVAVFYKSSVTRNMLKEIDSISENAKMVKTNPVPSNTPMYFFITDGNDVLFPNWKKQLTKYVSELNCGRYKYLECGHFAHHEKSDIIADGIKEFINSMPQS